MIFIFFNKKRKVSSYKHKGLNNQGPITNLRFEPYFSIILLISCNLKIENDLKDFIILNRT